MAPSCPEYSHVHHPLHLDLELRLKKHLRKLRCKRIPPDLLTPPVDVDAPGEISDANLMGIAIQP